MTPGESLVLPGPCGPLTGTLRVPPSKSLTNRALVAAAVAGGGRVLDPLDCEDTRLLAGALSAAGWELRWDEDGVRVGKRRSSCTQEVCVDLGNSGTGARLMVALLASVDGRFIVDGTARLRQRPVAPLIEALRAMGAKISCESGGFPVTIDGRRLAGGRVTIRPQVSSQFVTALLLVAPLFEHGLELEVAGSLPSAPYLELTTEVLRGFGAELEHTQDLRSWKVTPARLRPATWQVEGDWSAAAFPLAGAAVVGGSVEVGPLFPHSRQGDRVVCDILSRAGLDVLFDRDRVVAEGAAVRPVIADLRSCPDAFPALAAVAGCGPPGSRLTGLGNLKHKESDRLAAMAHNLRSLGAELEVTGETFTVSSTIELGGRQTRPVNAAADHRIAMAMAVTALRAGPLLLDDSACVVKSFPGFWDHWWRLVATAGGELG